MDNTSILDTVKEIISEITGLAPEEITDDASLVMDIGLSSFETIELLNELEISFQRAIPTQGLRKVESVRDLANLVSECQK